LALAELSADEFLFRGEDDFPIRIDEKDREATRAALQEIDQPVEAPRPVVER
jgi:hypothetical protein